MMKEQGIAENAIFEKGESLAEQGKTPLYFAEDKKLLGVIAVADVDLIVLQQHHPANHFS